MLRTIYQETGQSKVDEFVFAINQKGTNQHFPNEIKIFLCIMSEQILFLIQLYGIRSRLRLHFSFLR